MKKKFTCYECNEDISEKVVKKAMEGKYMIRSFTQQPIQKEKIVVECSKGHKNLFEIPSY